VGGGGGVGGGSEGGGGEGGGGDGGGGEVVSSPFHSVWRAPPAEWVDAELAQRWKMVNLARDAVAQLTHEVTPYISIYGVYVYRSPPPPHHIYIYMCESIYSNLYSSHSGGNLSTWRATR